MKIARIILVIAGLVLALGVANHSIRVHQQVVDTGRQILLELRPVDPRSLIQGDYMLLRYSTTAFPEESSRETLPSRGTFVMSVDANGIATYARPDDGRPLVPSEVRLRFNRSGSFGDPGLGAETFNFEEGQAETYADAKYGVLRVDESGMSVLVGLADESYALIVPLEQD